MIKILDKLTASRIAAGEVIDRTASVVRELLDNAIDAGSTEISVYIRDGGIKEIKVTDNGCGMSREDLEICFLPHATSKLETAEDLFSIRTMGFRGEALSSIAASGRLEIVTSTDGESGNEIAVDGGKIIRFGAVKSNKGTVVTVRDLFCYLPARKKFLKSTVSEGAGCRNIFIEKAAAFPDISFRLVIDGKLSMFLPAGSMRDRIAAAYPALVPEKLYHEADGSGEGFSFHIYFPGVEYSRRDRKYIKIYVNRRCIQEFSLVQAICYGLAPFFPGGTYPAAFLYLEIEPSLVDFNIHPAKKEVKIKNLPSIHHAVVEALAKCMDAPTEKRFEYKAPELIENIVSEKPVETKKPGFQYSFPRPAEKEISLLRERPAVPVHRTEPADFRYLGQIFGCFLLCEKGGTLYIIDQHASQERFFYNSFLEEKDNIQPLLLPFYLEADKEILEMTEKNIPLYDSIGISIRKDEGGALYIDALPTSFFELKNDVLELIISQKGNIENIKTELYARAACKKSIKAGDSIDYEKALELIGKVFEMPLPRCPHGRPLYVELTKEKLYELIGRT